MKNIVIMCRPEGASGVTDVMQLQREESRISLARDVNAVAKVLIDNGYLPVVCNMSATRYDAVSLLYKNYLADGIKDVSAWEMRNYFPDCEGAILIGMTAKAGTEKAFCAGTYNHVAWHDYYINGKTCGESEIYKTYFDSVGIPVLAVSGDEACCKEIAEAIPDAIAIQVKDAQYRLRATAYDPETVAKRFAEATQAALAKSGKTEYKPNLPLSVKISYNRTDFCDDSFARNNRRLDRTDARTLVKTVDKLNSIFDLVF